MNNKKKFAFLSVTLASMLVFSACNKPAETTKPESTTSAQPTETTQSVAPSESSPTSVAPTTSSTNPPSSSSSSSSSTSVAPTVVSIAVNLDNVKTAYTRGEALNLTGLVVTGTFSDGTSRAVRSYTTNPANGTVLNEVGEKDIVVTYKEVTTSFKVTVANQKFTVKFVVNGQEVQSGEVEEGQKAAYNGETPTKAADANAVKYRFKGWDKDLNQPITQDTTFTAVFAEYAAAQMIDDFESYTSNGDMADAWTVEAYKNNAWGETTASVVIGSKAKEGNKALRFNAWENNVGFRFLKHNEVGAFSKSANAIKFHMQVPSINTVKVILKGKATINGQEQAPSFTYEFHPATNEYVEYVVPLADDAWQLWGEAGKTIKTAADMIGAHVDDIPNYITDVGFFVQGNDGGSNLPFFMFADDIKFVTLDEPVAKSEVETMGQYTRYTGLLNNGYTVKVELGANGAATATILDAPQQQVIQGNVAIDAQKNMTFTSADNGASLVYKAALKNGGQSMKFVQASGQMAEAVTNVDLNAVQVVDNFEQYTEDGLAYYESNKDVNNRKGCRGAYYSEYYSGSASDSSPWGGEKWNLLRGSGDQLKLKNDNGGHNGSKNYLCVKHSKTVAMRYMQWGLFDGTAEQNNFRGSKFSFWAKTNGLVNNFKVSLYSQSAPTNATKDQYVKYVQANPTEAIGQWTHFECDLNPNVAYYGYMIFTEKNKDLNADQAWLYIDDVEVYTANPYATYVPPEPPVTYGALKNGQVFFANIAGYAGSTLTVKKNNAVTLDFPMMDTTIEGTYTQENDQISFGFGAYGTYVANINADSNKLEYVSATGVIQTFGEFTFNEMDVLDNAESYTESGKMYYQNNKDVNNRSGARGAYYCDYYSGGSGSTVGGSGWSLMGGSGDQLSLDTTEAHSGSNSLKMKRNKSNAMRYMTWGLFDGSAEGHTGANYFSYWVKNPNSVALTVKTSVYYQATVTAGTQQSNRAYVEAQIPANSDWTQVVIPLDPAKTYYGVAYVPATVSGGGAADFFYVDDAMFYSEEMNIAAPFLAIKGLEMSGALANGAAASITLGEQGKCKLTCAALGGSLDATFTLIGDKMTITVPPFQGGEKTVITGTYAPSDQAGVVTFTVISTTGEMAAYLPANTVFQGTLA
ncbi:MAG: bacterial Ig-like domain-containing protein [Bacilli bacterium]|nr:bacterial Ig-like domain-containing protein [Bacilli bacterium]